MTAGAFGHCPARATAVIGGGSNPSARSCACSRPRPIRRDIGWHCRFAAQPPGVGLVPRVEAPKSSPLHFWQAKADELTVDVGPVQSPGEEVAQHPKVPPLPNRRQKGALHADMPS